MRWTIIYAKPDNFREGDSTVTKQYDCSSMIINEFGDIVLFGSVGETVFAVNAERWIAIERNEDPDEFGI